MKLFVFLAPHFQMLKNSDIRPVHDLKIDDAELFVNEVVQLRAEFQRAKY